MCAILISKALRLARINNGYNVHGTVVLYRTYNRDININVLLIVCFIKAISYCLSVFLTSQGQDQIQMKVAYANIYSTQHTRPTTL